MIFKGYEHTCMSVFLVRDVLRHLLDTLFVQTANTMFRFPSTVSNEINGENDTFFSILFHYER